MKYYKLYIAIIILVYNTLAVCQKPDLRFHHLTVDNGLSQNWATCIFQDSYGFLWIGTGGNGMNKYNGYDFYVYLNDPKNKNSLSNNNIKTIYEDKKKRLWVGTQSGLNLYDRGNDKFIIFPPLENYEIIGLCEFIDGKFLVVCTVNIFEIKENKAIPYFKNNIESNPINGMHVIDQSGNLWLSMRNAGIFRFDINDKSLVPFVHNNKGVNSLSSNRSCFFYADNKKRIWIGTTDMGLSLIKNTKDSSPYFQNFIPNPSDPTSLGKGTIRTIIDDGQGLPLGLP